MLDKISSLKKADFRGEVMIVRVVPQRAHTPFSNQ